MKEKSVSDQLLEIKEALTEKKFRRMTRIMFGLRPMPVWVIAKVFQQLPEDTVFVGVVPDATSARWGWVLCSEKFDEVEQGASLPELVVEVDSKTKEVKIALPLGKESFMDALGEV